MTGAFCTPDVTYAFDWSPLFDDVAEDRLIETYRNTIDVAIANEGATVGVTIRIGRDEDDNERAAWDRPETYYQFIEFAARFARALSDRVRTWNIEALIEDDTANNSTVSARMRSRLGGKHNVDRYRTAQLRSSAAIKASQYMGSICAIKGISNVSVVVDTSGNATAATVETGGRISRESAARQARAVKGSVLEMLRDAVATENYASLATPTYAFA